MRSKEGKDRTSFLERGNSQGKGSLVEEEETGELGKASMMEQSEKDTSTTRSLTSHKKGSELHH